jgi:small-conductance mechanosensitive channel
MDFLNHECLGNPLWLWGAALGITAAVLGGFWILKRILRLRFIRLAEQTASGLDDYIRAVLSRTQLALWVILALYIGSLALSLPARATSWMGVVALIVLLVQIAIWVDALIVAWLRHYTEQHIEEDAEEVTRLRILSFAIRLGLYTIVVLLALDNIPGIEITTLIAGLGVGGIAVALAVQNILGDLLASLSIALDQPFAIGDFVVVGEFSGKVEHIGLKSTRIRSLSGEEVIVGNSDLLGSRIRNYRSLSERLVILSFGVAYQTSYDRLQQVPTIVQEIVQSQTQARFTRAHIKEFSDSGLTVEVVYFVPDADFKLFMDVRQAVTLGIYRRFEEEGIQFARPVRVVYVNKEDNGQG